MRKLPISLFFILGLLVCSQTYGITYVLNEEDSNSQLFIQTTVSAGSVSDSNSVSSSDLFFDKSISCSANSPNSSAQAEQSLRFKSVFSPDAGNPSWPTLPDPWPVDMNVSITTTFLGSGSAQGDGYYDPLGEWHWEEGAMSCDLEVHGRLCWNLLPSEPSEHIGMPIRVLVWADYYLGMATSNVANPGPTGITNLTFNNGAVEPRYSYGLNWQHYSNRWFGPNPLKSETFVIPLGWPLKIDYDYEVHLNGPLPGNSCYWRRPWEAEAPPELTDLYMCARAEPVELLTKMDKRYLREKGLLDELQNRETLDPNEEEVAKCAIVDGACADGVTQLILALDLSDDADQIFKPDSPPTDTENPQRIRLSILSPDGKDNGRLIGEGQDDSDDDYNDTPRIADGLFTQTWCAPAKFDNVLGSANREKMRKIPVQIEVDVDDDGTYDYAFIEFINLKRGFMITFDDGPVSGKTDSILLQLMKFKVDDEPVKAGFFMVGDNDPYYHGLEWPWLHEKGSVKKDPSAAYRVSCLGHIIGNHTQHHAWFGWWGPWGFLMDPIKWLDIRTKYDSLNTFVQDEISDCNDEITQAIGKIPTRIFRVPYLYENREVIKTARGLGYTVVWGEVIDTWDGWPNSLLMTKKKALQTLMSWKEDGPCVLIFHDIRSVTYEHIAEIIEYLQSEGFTLVHFDPSRIPNQINENTPKQALSGVAHSPVDLRITDPDGLILSKEENQIPDALYEELDVDEDGKLDDFFIIPESKAGCYLVEVIPEANALPDDTYSLEVAHGESVIVLAENVRVDAIPPAPYSVVFTEDADLNSDSKVNFKDFSMLAAHWMDSDCNQVNNWCSGSDLDASGNVDFIDLDLWADHWLEGVFVPIPADFNGDGKVDLDDIKVLAEQWLQSLGGLSADIAPTPVDGTVNFLDFAVLADHWLEGTNP